jgi:predicted RNA-binding protein YlxR (DUF448 family)
VVVRTSRASESVHTGSPGPVRTCIGCRERSAAAELLRVVVASGTGQGAGSPEHADWLVVPDPRHRAPGRGAWLHRDLTCVELAQRRRAFARALRTSRALDPTLVREYVAGR